MQQPGVKTIFIIVVFNVMFFMLSFGLQSAFGGTAIMNSDINSTNIVIPTIPDISFGSIGEAETTIFGVIGFAIDSITLFIKVFSFDVEGVPDLVRFMIVVPITIVDVYILFLLLLTVAEVVGGWIPFT